MPGDPVNGRMSAITKATRECLEILGALRFQDTIATTEKD